MGFRRNWIILIVILVIIISFNFTWRQCRDITELGKFEVRQSHRSIHLLVPENDAIPPTTAEQAGKAKCSFYDQNGGLADCRVETRIHQVIRRFLPRDSVVMEIGARYGTTACAIAHQQENSGQLLAVEPDIKAVSALIRNQISHFCKFHIVAGAVTENPVYLINDQNYNTLIAPKTDKEAKKLNLTKMPNFSWESVEEMIDTKVDSLVIDCEGCAISFLEEYFEKKHAQLNTVVLEMDGDLKVLNHWLDEFKNVGFSVWKSDDSRFAAITRQRD